MHQFDAFRLHCANACLWNKHAYPIRGVVFKIIVTNLFSEHFMINPREGLEWNWRNCWYDYGLARTLLGSNRYYKTWKSLTMQCIMSLVSTVDKQRVLCQKKTVIGKLKESNENRKDKSTQERKNIRESINVALHWYKDHSGIKWKEQKINSSNSKKRRNGKVKGSCWK